MACARRLMRVSGGFFHSDRCSSSSSSSSGRGLLGFPWIHEGKRTRCSRFKLNKRFAAPMETEKHCEHEERIRVVKVPAVIESLVRLLGLSAKRWRLQWRFQTELLIDQGIIRFQSFTLIAVAGSLIGSVLCFLEGCFLVLESFLQYFQTLSQNANQGGIIKLLIEAIDMFLVGSSFLAFAMSFYVMFMGSNGTKQGKSWPRAESKPPELSIHKAPASMEVQSISQAKSQLGHAMVMTLQVGVLDKFKNVPLCSAMDLACFAGALFISSASVFLLSKLSMPKKFNESRTHAGEDASVKKASEGL